MSRERRRRRSRNITFGEHCQDLKKNKNKCQPVAGLKYGQPRRIPNETK
jgi:hypothetical protein